MTDRSDILQKVLNLRALSEGTGSQHEALAALAIADKMMSAYRVTEAELSMAEALGEIKVDIVDEFQFGIKVGTTVRHKAQACIWMIKDYCEVKAVIQNNDRIRWIGDKPDVELAMYLFDLVREGMDRSYSNWKKTQPAVGRAAKGAFQVAMASAINSKLSDLKYERDKDRKATVEAAARALNAPEAEAMRYAVANGRIQQLSDTALVVVAAAETKRVAVEDSYRKIYAGVKLGRASGFSYRNGSASDAGRAAGRSFNIARPLGGANGRRLS